MQERTGGQEKEKGSEDFPWIGGERGCEGDDGMQGEGVEWGE